jgi:hypothetical protein
MVVLPITSNLISLQVSQPDEDLLRKVAIAMLHHLPFFFLLYREVVKPQENDLAHPF